MNAVAAKGAFLPKVCPPVYATVNAVIYVKQEAQEKQYCERGGLTNEGLHNLLLLYKQAHDKRGIAESLHAHMNRTRLCVMWAYF